MNDRDRSDSPDGMDRWLREALVSEGGAVPSECLDTEMLAAWAEGVLSGVERSFAEAHAARCARCQSMLAVMARTVPPETASPRSSLRKWLMMLTPAAAAVAAVVVWFAVEPRQRDTAASLPQSASSSTPPSSSAAAPEDRAAAPATVPAPMVPPPTAPGDKDGARGDAFERADAKSARSAAGGAADEADQRGRRDPRLARGRTRPLAVESEPLAKRTEIDALAGAGQKGPLPPVSRPATPAPATPAESPPGAVVESVPVTGQTPPVQNRQAAQSAQAAQNEEARLRQQPQTQQQQPPPSPQSTQQNAAANAPPPATRRGGAEPLPTPPPPPPAKPAALASADASLRDARAEAAAGRGGAVAVDSERTLQSKAALSQPLVVARDGKTRWRVSQRVIQQSVNGGATWATQFTLDEGTVLVSGATPSSPSAPSSVCWFVGASGAIVATSDGRTWRRVRFPYTVDLVGVTLTNARNVVVIASDQRVFVTTDGGERWMANRD